MYVLEDDGVKAECVVTDEGGGVYELKNLAVTRPTRDKAMDAQWWIGCVRTCRS